VTLDDDIRRTLGEIRAARLQPERWTEVADELDALAAAGDDVAVRAALVPLSRVAFEGKVRRTMPAGGKAASLAPTKQTSALPLVGSVCGGLIMAAGWSIGGGVVLAGAGAFALFILGIAVAGSRVAHSRPRDEVADTSVLPPADVDRALRSFESRPSGP
jgi:hypothetical protein